MTTEEKILFDAFNHAGNELGFDKSELSRVIGVSNSITDSIKPDSKQGERAILFVRCYRAVFGLLGSDSAVLQHWFAVRNHGTGGIPKEQVKTVKGLHRVLTYLDAMRGEI